MTKQPFFLHLTSRQTIPWMDERDDKLNNLFWWITGFCAAIGFLIFAPKRTPPIALLAHRLEDAWADHHTVVETS
jgi:hypothetical protein